VLRWDSAGRRLWTDAPVRLVRQENVIEGRSFELQIPEETAVISGPVRATLVADRRR